VSEHVAVAVKPDPDRAPVVQMVVEPLFIVTVPVGTPLPESPVTVAVKTSTVSLPEITELTDMFSEEFVAWPIVRVKF
jgi:hypothetical protein